MQFRFRSLVQFRLATLLIAITLVGVWLGVWTDRANRQKRALAAIAAARGEVHFAHEFDAADHGIPDAQPPGPKWLRQMIGDDYLQRVAVVYLADTEYYGDLKAFGLSQINNEVLRSFESLPDVEVIQLMHTRAITDAGLSHLRSLKKLQALYLHDCHVTGTGCAQLAALPNLKVLDLSRNPLTPAGLKELRGMTQVVHLTLEDTPVADDDLAALQQLANLSQLDLAGTRVTDAGLVHLEKLTGLRHLSLPDSVTPRAGLRLRQSLPQCQMFWRPEDPHRARSG